MRCIAATRRSSRRAEWCWRGWASRRAVVNRPRSVGSFEHWALPVSAAIDDTRAARRRRRRLVRRAHGRGRPRLPHQRRGDRSAARTGSALRVDVVVVPLPHYRGPADVFHLMSILSPIDRDLAVVYSPLMPVPFREWLIERGIALRRGARRRVRQSWARTSSRLLLAACVMLEGNPITRARLEAAGAEVLTYDGSEISVKGGGGPTCLTRPLERLGPLASREP